MGGGGGELEMGRGGEAGGIGLHSCNMIFGYRVRETVGLIL